MVALIPTEIKADPRYHQSLVELGKASSQASDHVPGYPGGSFGGQEHLPALP